jgi:type IV pilus assembly protein PilC
MMSDESIIIDGPSPPVWILVSLVFAVAYVLPAAGLVYTVYYGLTLPMRRSERARLFLDLLEMGLKQGRTPEAAIAGPAAGRDRSLGARFHLLAGYLQQGLRFGQAMDLVPHFLPPQVLAMLKAGERVGDMTRVLPACRQNLKDAISNVRGALNYVILVTLAMTPVVVFVPVVLRVKVMPKFQEVFAGMLDNGELPAFTRLIFASNTFTLGVSFGLFCLLWVAVSIYVGGPSRVRLPWLSDRIAFRVPWRRKRMQRDFSSMLAALLDAGVPEAEAVSLAAEATANGVMKRRAAKACALLRDGTKLPDALGVMDDSPELQWRLANALKGGRGFLQALTGWHEALDARAFQLEQAGAQIMTTTLVLLNGLLVGCFVVAVFLALISLINQVALW